MFFRDSCNFEQEKILKINLENIWKFFIRFANDLKFLQHDGGHEKHSEEIILGCICDFRVLLVYAQCEHESLSQKRPVSSELPAQY